MEILRTNATFEVAKIDRDKDKDANGIDRAAMAEISAEIASCHICAEQGYVAISRPIERGQSDKQILVIGQAPGFTEGTRQVAFGGPAGRTLMRWFGSIGLSEAQVRSDTYLSAITKCYPGRAPKGGGDRNPSPIERANCRPYLLRELLAVKPKIVILIGSTAVKEVYGGNMRLEDVIGTTTPMNLGEFYARLKVRLITARRIAAEPLPKLPNVDWEQRLDVFHLPHPSGASTWLNSAANQALLQKSLVELAQHLCK